MCGSKLTNKLVEHTVGDVVTLNIYEAKTRLSALVRRAALGEEIVIACDGRPMARLVPLARLKKQRVLGEDRGMIWVAPDFDETPVEMTDARLASPLLPSDDSPVANLPTRKPRRTKKRAKRPAR